MSGYIGNIPVPQATQTRDNFTATASQTTFTTSGYTPGYLDVYLNGVHLDPTDYTAANGTDVVLATGATSGDVVSVVAWSTFEISSDTFANAVTFNDGLTVDKDGATVATFDRATSDGTIVDLQKNGTAIGSIGAIAGVSATVPYICSNQNGTLNVGLRFDADPNQIQPCQANGADRDAGVSLGGTNHRFKDLYLSGGVYLGGTTSTNYLDDYEEGEWTATFAGSATTATGKYVKTGALVHVQVFATLNVTSSVTATISGLPFPVITYSVGTAAHNNYTSNADQGYFSSGGTAFTFMNDSSVNPASTVTGNPKYTMVAGTYYTTS